VTIVATSWSDPLAVATFTLAFFTFLLGVITWTSVKTSARQVEIEQRRLTAAQKPRVFPAPSREWTDGAAPYDGPLHRFDVIPVTNGGLGPALNVRARLEYGGRGSGTVVQTVPTSLAPNASADLRLNSKAPSDWSNVAGGIVYEDVSGGLWQTDFRITQEGGHIGESGSIEGGRLYFDVRETELLRPPAAESWATRKIRIGELFGRRSK
jgi:hypothetical protein